MVINASDKFIIGVDLGGTNLKIALLDLKYRIKDRVVLGTKRFHKKEDLILAITDGINNVITDKGLKKAHILGVGLGLPGPIDAEKGVVHFLPNIPGWKEVGLKRILESKLELSVFLDNDANLMSLAECRLGAARGFNNVICLTLGTGVGGGIIIAGRLYRGADNASGEIGHVPINESGPRCNCGGRGCLERYVGNASILREARRAFRRNISLEELSSLARQKNMRARRIWLAVSRRLASALVGAINLLNPDCIVVGGGVANAGKVLFDNLRRIVSVRAMRIQAGHVKIVKAALGSDAGIIGAAIIVKEGINT